MDFQIRRSTPLFVLSAPRPFPLRERPAQTLHSAHGFGNPQASREPFYARLSCFMPSRVPGMKPASHAAPRQCEAITHLPASFRLFCRV